MASSVMRSRAQQSADSPVASLPTETLAQILVASLEGLEPWERHQTRMRFSKVCSGWYEVAQTGQELVVKDSKMEQRLTKALTTGGAARRHRVHSLCITVGTYEAGRGKRLADLIKLCRQVKVLEFRDMHILGDGSTYLGTHLHSALRDLKQLEHFTIADSPNCRLSAVELYEAIKKWPRIRSVDVLGMILECEDDLAVKTSTLPLVHLGLSPFNYHRSALRFFLTASKPALRHLDLGAVGWPDNLSSEVMSPVVDIAPQLGSFALKTKRYYNEPFSRYLYLMTTLRALKEVRTIELGINGFDFAAIFSVLEPLEHLKTLSITESSVSSTYAPFEEFDTDSVAHFLSHASALESLTLPHQLDMHWSAPELEELEETAIMNGVDFKMA